MIADNIWDIRVREREEINRIVNEIDFLRSKISIALESSSIKTSSGFQSFKKAIEGLYASHLRRLTSDQTLTDAGLREFRGRAAGVMDVMSIINSETAIEPLQVRLDFLQKELDHVRKIIPRSETQKNERELL